MMEQLDWARYGLVDPRAIAEDAAWHSLADSSVDDQLLGLADTPVEFLWNGKTGGEVLLDTIEHWLVDNTHLRSLGQTAKLLPNTTAPDELITEIVARASLVFTGPGD
jgi:hypothetical protein